MNGSPQQVRRTRLTHFPLRGLVVALVLILLSAATALPAAGARQSPPNGAGLVVRHGDGTLIYAYVEFEGETISGEELLLQSGLDFVVSLYPGLGTGICEINGEGCPADDCYCESYTSPAYFWQYFGWNGSSWESHLRGPTGRQLADGDIDGWSWTAGNHDLPPVTIDEIAAITGFDRGPEATATPQPTDTPPPTETPVPEPTATPTPLPPATETPVPEPTVTATLTPSEAPTTIPATPTNTPGPTSTPIPTRTATSTPAPSATPAEETEPAATAATGAVIVRPGATPSPVEVRTSGSDDGRQNLLLFGGFAAVIVAGGALVLIRSRQAGG